MAKRVPPLRYIDSDRSCARPNDDDRFKNAPLFNGCQLYLCAIECGPELLLQLTH
jgi:hypothetical protein